MKKFTLAKRQVASANTIASSYFLAVRLPLKKIISRSEMARLDAWAALLVLTGSAAWAAGPDLAVAPFIPGAGAILQSVQPPSLPQPSSIETGLSLQSKANTQLPPSAPFMVTSIRFIGNTVFTADLLRELVKDAEGKALTLEQVGELADRITDYYRGHGYPLARAIVPAQTIQEGAVTFQVIEARYGKVVLDNKSGVGDTLLSATLSTLQPNDLISKDNLNQALLLLSDIPGMTVEVIAQPGQTVGTSDLVLNVAPLPMVTGSAFVDNSGSRYTGQDRVGANVNISNPLHHGDVLSATALSSGRGMTYGQLSYETLLNGRGTRVGGSGSGLHYLLNSIGHGTADVASLWVKQPLVRSQSHNVYAQLQVDSLWLNDLVDTDKSQKDRKLLNTSISLNGDVRDLLPQGLTSWKAALTAGHVSFSNQAAQLYDAQTVQTQGNFVKYSIWGNHQQPLTAKDSLYLAFSGQTANTNLDPSQKMTLGGPNSVRAYATGAISGDNGTLLTVELRHLLDSALFGTEGLWQVMAFVDSAHVSINKIPRVSGINQATLSGGGIGLLWAGAKQLTVQLTLAERIGSLPALITSGPKVRAWAVVSKGF
jgi:hemolysin activation/secretion protein